MRMKPSDTERKRRKAETENVGGGPSGRIFGPNRDEITARSQTVTWWELRRRLSRQNRWGEMGRICSTRDTMVNS